MSDAQARVVSEGLQCAHCHSVEAALQQLVCVAKFSCRHVVFMRGYVLVFMASAKDRVCF